MQMIAPASLGGLHSRIGDILLVIWCMASIVYDVNRSSVISHQELGDQCYKLVMCLSHEQGSAEDCSATMPESGYKLVGIKIDTRSRVKPKRYSWSKSDQMLSSNSVLNSLGSKIG